MISRLLLPVAFLFALGASVAAQVENSSSVVWERYKVSQRKVSFLFPKMPTVHETPSVCGELTAITYLAYAQGVIYEVVIAGPRRSLTQVNCGGRIITHSPRKLDDRLAELRKMDRYREQTVRVSGTDGTYFSWNKGSRWIIPDSSTAARWTEVAISHYPNNRPDASRLTESFLFTAVDGIEIGEGSPVTLGDKGVVSSIGATSNLLARTTSPLTLYWRPRTYYTERARREKVEGSVLLRVAFRANGSIGPIRVEKQLPHGLTEIAVASVRKISFLPKRVNGLPVDDEQTLEFKFGVY